MHFQVLLIDFDHQGDANGAILTIQRLTPDLLTNKETSLVPTFTIINDVGYLEALEEAPLPLRLVFAECASSYTSRRCNERQAVDTEA